MMLFPLLHRSFSVEVFAPAVISSLVVLVAVVEAEGAVLDFQPCPCAEHYETIFAVLNSPAAARVM